MRHRIIVLIGLGFLALAAWPGAFGREEDRVLRLDIGDRRYKGQTMDVRPGVILSARTGRPVAFDQLVRELDGCRFVYIGESHNSLPMHDIQYEVIRALHEREPALVVGLEPMTEQEPLAKWSLGLLTESEFIAEGRWYVTWNFNFGYYRKIFDYCRQMGIPLRPLNVPREIITRIRMGGWEALPDDQKKLVPAPDLSNPDHRRLIRAVFESADLPPQMKGAGLDMVFEGLYRSQVAWDQTMAANALRASRGGRTRVVVLAGSGHLLYNLGINLRVAEKASRPGRTIICVTVPAGTDRVTVSRGLADYVWGIPEETRTAYPEIGLAFKTFTGLDNLVVDRKPIDGAAAAADFDKGDVILAVDGKGFSDINVLRTYLAGFGWDQEVKFRILRAGQDKEVVLKLVQPPPQEPSK